MIRSTKVATKFCNRGKLQGLKKLSKEYSAVVSFFVDRLWDKDDVPSFVNSEISSGLKTTLSARLIQCAGKQASGIVRGARKKQGQRIWKVADFNKRGMFKKARILQAKVDLVKVSKPKISEIPMELDSRFVKIDLNNETSFDGWLTLSSLGKSLKIIVPFKKSAHFNKMLSRGAIKSGVRIEPNGITFLFEIPDAPKKAEGRILGIDIGQISTLSSSDGQQINQDAHGHSYQSICDSLARKKRGSKNFRREVAHRSNFLHWTVNRLRLDGVKTIRFENIKNLRRGNRTSSSLTHWNYAELFGMLESRAEELGVQVLRSNPALTSQRCFVCGWVHKGSRKSKRFVCSACGNAGDADTNASSNLSLDLPPITEAQWRQFKSKIGFYWRVIGGEPIVPGVLKANDLP